MTGYALVVDGQIEQVGLPDTGTLRDGTPVSGFDKLDGKTLREQGWLPIEDPGAPSPEHVRELQVLKTKVVARYSRPAPNPDTGRPDKLPGRRDPAAAARVRELLERSADRTPAEACELLDLVAAALYPAPPEGPAS